MRAAIDLLQTTDADLLRMSYFDPDLLDELAFDPRAYDFDHPVNRRPNYHFGQWDPHQIDNQGRYRRFVVQQVTLDALMTRYEATGGLPKDQLLFEAAAVLAGTILMAAGVSGRGPETHDSTVTLATLLPQIAHYRDEFYERLIAHTEGEHGRRLRGEAIDLRQPFGGARQSLNAELARQRARQLEHVHLARIFARMGYADAAKRQADIVPVASARMLCRIDNRVTLGHRLVDSGEMDRAAELPTQIVDFLHRSIQCGAVIDPWNILGFDANFSLFPALENSIHDHRADELIELMERVFALVSRIWSEAAALDRQDVCEGIDLQFRELAEWWRQFATHEVSSVKRLDSLEVYNAAKHVVEAMRLWHRGGAATGDVRFWAPHAEMFDAPKAYALVLDALLERRDFIASMSLLIHWLSQADRVPLEQGDVSFSRLAERWLLDWFEENGDQADGQRWKITRKFFDYIEANAEDYWSVPRFEIGSSSRSTPKPDDPFADEPYAGEVAEEDEDNELFGAAYEDVVYRDSTDDGVEGAVFETDDRVYEALERESQRVVERLSFISCLARMWKVAAVTMGCSPEDPADEATLDLDDLRATLGRWINRARHNGNELRALLEQVRDYHLPKPSADHESLLEYDRQRLVKESLLERIIVATVEMSDAVRLLSAAVAARNEGPLAPNIATATPDAALAIVVFAALLRRDLEAARTYWGMLLEAYRSVPLLYVPLARGGDPGEIVTTRIRQRAIQDLLTGMPRAGLLLETTQLVETARAMERRHPVGPGAVTEFDELFRIGYTSLVEAIVRSSHTWDDEDAPSDSLVASLEEITESLLRSWLAHSRTLRLSVLEKVEDAEQWNATVEFIQRYGADIFTQRFLNLGNIRAILHQGVDVWLEQLAASENQTTLKLIDELDDGISSGDADALLTIILESIVENYGEYRDYNSTTTQSDRGEMLYSLLDFLRLRSRYDRVSWNLRPVVWAHELLVRNGQNEAARMWRRALRERVGEQADKYLAELAQLQKKYAMRMPTVADRLNERFIKPMTIDRMRALVKPAMQTDSDHREASFEMLESLTNSLTREPSGVGLDLPPWLEALEEEVEHARGADIEVEIDELLGAIIPSRPLTLAEVDDQLERIATLVNHKRRS
ncbi:MAG: hypothetical protein R3C99_08650 [Pirellulaceae bacterium]